MSLTERELEGRRRLQPLSKLLKATSPTTATISTSLSSHPPSTSCASCASCASGLSITTGKIGALGTSGASTAWAHRVYHDLLYDLHENVKLCMSILSQYVLNWYVCGHIFCCVRRLCQFLPSHTKVFLISLQSTTHYWNCVLVPLI